MINATVGSLPDGTVGLDTTAPLNLILAKQYVNHGYGFVVRYIGRADGSTNYVDLSEGEAQAIIDAGLALSVVQHPLGEGWSPSGTLGHEFGAAAARLAGGAGLLPGITVWLDLEGVRAATPEQAVIDYCNEWYDEVNAVGFNPGVYVGANPGLTGDQIYWDLSMKSYWRGGSSVTSGVPADLPYRGYQMEQRITGSGASEFDSDVTHADKFAASPLWCLAR